MEDPRLIKIAAIEFQLEKLDEERDCLSRILRELKMGVAESNGTLPGLESLPASAQGS